MKPRGDHEDSPQITQITQILGQSVNRQKVHPQPRIAFPTLKRQGITRPARFAGAKSTHLTYPDNNLRNLCNLWIVLRSFAPGWWRRFLCRPIHRMILQQAHCFLYRPFELRIATSNYVLGPILHIDVGSHAFVLYGPLPVATEE